MKLSKEQILNILELLEQHFTLSRHVDFGYYNVSLKEKAAVLMEAEQFEANIETFLTSLIASYQAEEFEHKYSFDNYYIQYIDSQPRLFDLEADLNRMMPEARIYVQSSGSVEKAIETIMQVKESRKYPDKKKIIPSGYIYLIRSAMGYKIGKTKNIKQRSNIFSVKMPFEFEFVHYKFCNDYHVLEASLHNKYNHKRINGEWFDLLEEDVDEIFAILLQNEVLL